VQLTLTSVLCIPLAVVMERHARIPTARICATVAAATVAASVRSTPTIAVQVCVDCILHSVNLRRLSASSECNGIAILLLNSPGGSTQQLGVG